MSLLTVASLLEWLPLGQLAPLRKDGGTLVAPVNAVADYNAD